MRVIAQIRSLAASRPDRLPLGLVILLAALGTWLGVLAIGWAVWQIAT